MSTALGPALYSSMNESVVFAELEPMRNSLILIWLTLRAFMAAISECVVPLFVSVHEALPTRSPLKAIGPAVILKVALTLAPGATGSANVFDESRVPATTDVQFLSGKAMLNRTPVAGASVVLVNVTVVSCEDPGEKVCSP